MRISDWSADVCSSDLHRRARPRARLAPRQGAQGAALSLRTRRGGQDRPLGLSPVAVFGFASIDASLSAGRRSGGVTMPPETTILMPSSTDMLSTTTSGFGTNSRKPEEIGSAHPELQSLMRLSYAVFCYK